MNNNYLYEIELWICGLTVLSIGFYLYYHLKSNFNINMKLELTNNIVSVLVQTYFSLSCFYNLVYSSTLTFDLYNIMLGYFIYDIIFLIFFNKNVVDTSILTIHHITCFFCILYGKEYIEFSYDIIYYSLIVFSTMESLNMLRNTLSIMKILECKIGYRLTLFSLFIFLYPFVRGIILIYCVYTCSYILPYYQSIIVNCFYIAIKSWKEIKVLYDNSLDKNSDL